MDATAKEVAGIVGPRIRRIRRGLDMSQEALAENAEIHRRILHGTGLSCGRRSDARQREAG
jgi:hypothetical protein